MEICSEKAMELPKTEAEAQVESLQGSWYGYDGEIMGEVSGWEAERAQERAISVARWCG